MRWFANIVSSSIKDFTETKIVNNYEGCGCYACSAVRAMNGYHQCHEPMPCEGYIPYWKYYERGPAEEE